MIGKLQMKTLVSASIGAALIALACPAEAGLVTFFSGDGGDVLALSVAAGAGAVTPITPHPAWGDVSVAAGLAAGTARWLSYADTGIGGQRAPSTTDRSDPGAATATFTRRLEIADGGELRLFVLADDTARVELNGPGSADRLLFAAYPGQVDPCAPGGTGAGLGCVAADMGEISLSGLSRGIYLLTVHGFQTNGDVFGAQYAGSYTAVNEPWALSLIGLGLVAAGLIVRHRGEREAEPDRAEKRLPRPVSTAQPGLCEPPAPCWGADRT